MMLSSSLTLSRNGIDSGEAYSMNAIVYSVLLLFLGEEASGWNFSPQILQ